MQRWALFLSAYSYNIRFRPTKSHSNADGLSRLPLTDDRTVGNPEDPSVFNVAQIAVLPIQAAEVAKATCTDPVLGKLLICLRQGWPHEVPDDLVPYWQKRTELTLEGDCILRGIRVVVPNKLRQQVLDELHLGHPGVVRMKGLGRSHVWWPGFDKAVERVAKACVACQLAKNAPAKAPLHPWAWPTSPWERIHVDFAGPFLGKMLLVVMDAHSKWPEVCIMTTTTTAKTIAVLREIFSRNGLLRQLVSDNVPQFIAEDFARFMAENGVKHIRSAPYHPASNGAAEQLVQTVKQALRAGHQSGVPLEQSLASFLLRYRSTPHATTGVPPCTLFLNRTLRTRLDLLTPSIGARVKDKQTQQKKYSDQHRKERKLSIGQTVWARNFREGPRWVRAVVSDRSGPVSFIVKLEDGNLWRRHIDHLRLGVSATLEYPKVEEEPFPYFPPGEPALGAQTDGESPTVSQHDSSTNRPNIEEGAPPPPPPSRHSQRIRRQPERLYGTLRDGGYGQ